MKILDSIKNSKFIESIRDSFGSLFNDAEIDDEIAFENVSNNDAVAKEFAKAESNIIDFEEYREKMAKKAVRATTKTTTRKVKSYEEQALANDDNDELPKAKVR